MESNNTIKYQLPEAGFLASGEAMLLMAQSYIIDSPAMFEAAGEDLKNIKNKAKEMETMRVSITAPMDQAKKAVMDLFRKPQEFLSKAEGVIKGAMLNYQQEEQKKARQAQALLEETQRKAAEALNAKAVKAEEKGKTEQAEAFRDVAQMSSTPMVSQEQPKVAGISTRKTWKARVTDKRALVEAALTRPDIMALIVVDESALNKLAVALKENLTLPGVVAYPEESISARS